MIDAHKVQLEEFLAAVETLKSKMILMAPETLLLFLEEKLKAANEVEREIFIKIK